MFFIGIMIVAISVGSMYSASMGWLTFGLCLVVAGAIEAVVNYKG